jgi:AP-4 complex subunit mu-1
MVFNSNGHVTNSLVEGCIQMKSYLQPVLKVTLNEDLGIGKDSKAPFRLDEYSCSECVDSSDFEFTKSMKINPPEGEFLVMTYRVTGDYTQPFRVFPIISEIGPYKLEVFLKISSQIPKDTTPSTVAVRFHVPNNVVSVHNELEEKASASKQKADYVASNNLIEWHIRKFSPLSEHSLKTKISLQSNTNIAQAKKMIGPIKYQILLPVS